MPWSPRSRWNFLWRGHRGDKKWLHQHLQVQEEETSQRPDPWDQRHKRCLWGWVSGKLKEECFKVKKLQGYHKLQDKRCKMCIRFTYQQNSDFGEDHEWYRHVPRAWLVWGCYMWLLGSPRVEFLCRWSVTVSMFSLAVLHSVAWPHSTICTSIAIAVGLTLTVSPGS